MKLSIIIIKALFVSALFIVSNYNLHLADPGERAIFIEFYHDWLSRAYGGAIGISGDVINFDWLPPNNLSVDKIKDIKVLSGK